MRVAACYGMGVHIFLFQRGVVDGTFCHAALKGKIQIKEQLPKYLGGSVQLGMQAHLNVRV